jgi:hypothetical protein
MSRISTFFKSKDAKWYVERLFVFLVLAACTMIIVFADMSLNDFWQNRHGFLGVLWISFYSLLLRDYFDYKYFGKKLNIWSLLIFGAYLLVMPWFMGIWIVGLLMLQGVILFWIERRKWRREFEKQHSENRAQLRETNN